MQQGVPAGSDRNSTPSSFADVQTEFYNLAVELNIQQKICDTLSHQMEVLRLTSDAAPPFQIMMLAEVPDAKSGPKRVRIVEEAVVVAFNHKRRSRLLSQRRVAAQPSQKSPAVRKGA
jgi:hypothetical protein